MKDREFLMWIHERLEHVHGENCHTDYMHKLRAVICSIPPWQETLNLGSNSLEQLKKFLEDNQ